MEAYNACTAYGASAEPLAQALTWQMANAHIHVILSCEPLAALGASEPFLYHSQSTHFVSRKALTKCFNPLKVLLMRFFSPPLHAFDDCPLNDLLLFNPLNVRPVLGVELSATGTIFIGSIVIRGR